MDRFFGFDLGDAESAISRLSRNGQNVPEVLSIGGVKSVITAYALLRTGELLIGEQACYNAEAVRRKIRFKSRFLSDPASAGDVKSFAAGMLGELYGNGDLVKNEDCCFYIGCPAGWDKNTRERYREIFEKVGYPPARIVSESRAALVSACQSKHLQVGYDILAKPVLVVDIGSSTTDFAYINKGKEAEIRTGGEVTLGGGVMDELLLEGCVERSRSAAALRKVLEEGESWRVDCELHARQLKERYYSRPLEEREEEDCCESLLITYDEPLILDLVMDKAMSARLTDTPCRQLHGKSFREVFCEGLREVRGSIGSEQPELLFLTGGVSRMEEVRDWCREVFPEAVIYTDREPEFSVARGLAWCGKIDEELSRFRADVAELITSNTVEGIVSAHLNDLYRSALDALLDPLLERAVEPVLLDWRGGKLERLSDMEAALQEKIKVYLFSEDAKASLYQPITDWLLRVSGELEQYTSEICRRYHVPERSLEISSGLSATDFSLLERLEARDVLSGDTLTWTAVFVESIISILVAMLCGGSGVVLISEGPAGMLIGFVLSFLVLVVSHAMGKKAIDEKLMTANLPLAVRKMALSSALPKIEGPDLGLSRLWKSEEDGETKERFRLLPRLSWTDRDGISPRRLQAIRSKIRSNYEKLLDSEDNEELLALNGRMSRDISNQIEQRLQEMAEQVEIPL